MVVEVRDKLDERLFIELLPGVGEHENLSCSGRNARVERTRFAARRQLDEAHATLKRDQRRRRIVGRAVGDDDDFAGARIRKRQQILDARLKARRLIAGGNDD